MGAISVHVTGSLAMTMLELAIVATESFGHDRKLRTAHFFELAGQPVEVTMAVSEHQAEHMSEHLKQEGVKVFYVKTPIEFGMTGESNR